MSNRGGERSAKRAPSPNFTPTFFGAGALFGRGSGMFAGRGANAATTQPRIQSTPFDLAPVGTPFVKGGILGYKGPDNQWMPRGDLDAPIQTQVPAVIPAGTIQPAAIVTGLTPAGAVDRRKSDLYKQYAQTPAAQFERYFQTPEMTPYFGGAFQGKGAPTSAQAMIDLASQAAAPTTAPLASYYAAQSATGRGSTDEIISAMGYKGTPMEQWAKANPMLAFREFDKKYPSGALTQGPTPALPGPPMGEGGTAGQQALEAAQYQLFGDEPLAAQAAQQQATADQANMATTAGLSAGDRTRNLTRAFRLGLM